MMPYSPDSGPLLLALARGAIAARLGTPATPVADSPFLREPGASFVTLTCEGALRGCIGSLEAHRPLADDVRENALAAAFRDPRFAPLSAREWPAVRIEVSLLGPREPLAVSSEREAIAALAPGVDGVVLTAGTQRATFLPQVWEQLPDPAEFLARLRSKAGLGAAAWSADWQLERYRVQKWKESEG
ncbi:MAG: AmmeMemoRadiSam system protein A [Dechloromonas sp.]|nr:AmmeMemoRadiSam system protein A [Dechloromonas sp.]